MFLFLAIVNPVHAPAFDWRELILPAIILVATAIFVVFIIRQSDKASQSSKLAHDAHFSDEQRAVLEVVQQFELGKYFSANDIHKKMPNKTSVKDTKRILHSLQRAYRLKSFRTRASITYFSRLV